MYLIQWAFWLFLRSISALTCSKKFLFQNSVKKIALVVFVVFLFAVGFVFAVQPAGAQSVTILSTSGLLDSVDGFHIFGEFQNTQSQPIHIEKIVGTFFDSGNNVLDVVDWHTGYLEVVFPNQKSPFYVLQWNISDPSQRYGPQIDHYQVEIYGAYVSATVPEVVVLSNTSRTDSMDYMHITGEVQNTGTSTANYTKVYATFYDSSGKVICTEDVYTSSNAIAPQEKATYDVMMSYSILTPKIASYSLQAQAQPTITSKITPSPSTPAPSSPSPNENPTDGGVPVPAYTYVAWAPVHENVAAATLATVVVVGVVTAVASAVGSPVGSSASRAGENVKNLVPEGAKRWLEEFVSSKRKPVVGEKTGSPFLPTKPEALAYGVSLAALTIAFSYVKVPSLGLIWDVLPMVLVTAVIVEVARTYAMEVVARSKGIWAEHRLWYFGLAMFLVTTFAFGIPFSSPSRNIYHSAKMTKRLNAIVASASLLVTLAFAAAFFGLLVGGFTLIGGTGLAMCLIMGLVDAFPVEPLNGKAVFDHSKVLWAGLFAVMLAAYVSWLLLL